MDRRTATGLGIVSILSGILVAIVSVPPTWYGLQPTDAYVFDPEPWTPLWINRELVPALAIIASLGLLAGLGGLVVRDWSVAGRWRRWGGSIALIGMAGVTAGLPAILGPQGASATETIGFLVSLLVWVGGLVLLVIGLLLLAYGYMQTPRPDIGYALLGVLVGVPALSFIVPEWMGSLVVALPITITWAVLGRELLRQSTPLAAE